MKSLPTLPALLFAISLPAFGMEAIPDPEADSGSNEDSRIIQVQVEYVEMAHEDLTKLLFQAEPKSSDASELRKQVQEMIARKEAKIIETQLTTARPNEKATAESAAEKIYPTEYEPPELPNYVSSTAPGPGTPPASPPRPDSWQGVGPSVAVPTAFDTRNCGSKLETQAQASEDGKLVTVSLRPELVWHTGKTSWLELKDALGNTSKVEMADFYSLLFQTEVICAKGSYLMATVLSPKDERGIPDTSRKVMVFVKCEVLSAP